MESKYDCRDVDIKTVDQTFIDDFDFYLRSEKNYSTNSLKSAEHWFFEYNERTLEPALNQHERLTGKQAKSATVDRGCQGKSKMGETKELYLNYSTIKS